MRLKGGGCMSRSLSDVNADPDPPVQCKVRWFWGRGADKKKVRYTRWYESSARNRKNYTKILTCIVWIKLLQSVRHQPPRVIGSIILCCAKHYDRIPIVHSFYLSISWLSENILLGDSARWRTSSMFVQSTWAIIKLTNITKLCIIHNANHTNQRQTAKKMSNY